MQPEYVPGRELLKNQMQIGFPSAPPMFEYGKWDKAGDELALYGNTYKLTNRLGGLVQVGAGAASMGGGILVGAGGCGMSVGLACAGTVVAGGGMIAWGVDQGWAGGATLINGSPEPTWGGAALSNLFGMSPQTGEMLYGLAGFTVAAAGTTLSQLGTVSLKAPAPGTTGVMVGGTQYVESAAIQANTTVRLSESVALANGRVLPKGSIVTVSDDAMKVVLPDGTSSISSYSKAMTPPKALPAPGANTVVKVAPEIKLVDGFYQAEGSVFKFSEYYYNKLWSTGRGAPFLQADEVLNTAKTITPDRMPGFNRYVNDVFEMVYNPTTKEVWHIQPLRK